MPARRHFHEAGHVLKTSSRRSRGFRPQSCFSRGVQGSDGLVRTIRHDEQVERGLEGESIAHGTTASSPWYRASHCSRCVSPWGAATRRPSSLPQSFLSSGLKRHDVGITSPCLISVWLSRCSAPWSPPWSHLLRRSSSCSSAPATSTSCATASGCRASSRERDQRRSARLPARPSPWR